MVYKLVFTSIAVAIACWNPDHVILPSNWILPIKHPQQNRNNFVISICKCIRKTQRINLPHHLHNMAVFLTQSTGWPEEDYETWSVVKATLCCHPRDNLYVWCVHIVRPTLRYQRRKRNINHHVTKYHHLPFNGKESNVQHPAPQKMYFVHGLINKMLMPRE